MNRVFILLFYILAGQGLKDSVQAQTNKDTAFNIHYSFTEKDLQHNKPGLTLNSAFKDKIAAYTYINALPGLLQSMGHPAASVDSVEDFEGGAYVTLYLGKKYLWQNLSVDSIDRIALEKANFIPGNFSRKTINYERVAALQRSILQYYENTGYPFAKIYLDGVHLHDEEMSASLRVDKGIHYPIDSIRVYGTGKYNKFFLQKHLGIMDNSWYNRSKLEAVDRKLEQLPYVKLSQPSDVTLLGTGAVVNLYLEERKSSQVNFLIGFLPAATPGGKLQVTGDVNLDLNNLFGNGENMLLRWQSLQPQSPRLNIGYSQPYVFRSPFGISTAFELFKKDSSFRQVSAEAGVQFAIADNQQGKIAVQVQSNSLLEGAIDTVSIKQSRSLPFNADLSSVNTAFHYDWNNTNYRFNPRRGNEIKLVASVGLKKVKRNNAILSLKDGSFNFASLYDSIRPKSYQLRIQTDAAHFFPVGKQATVKTAANAGYYTSPNIFRNELFQIGGYRLLRGFNEQSIYATGYAVGTVEYRYLVGRNSYLFSFADAAYVQRKFLNINATNNFLGFGVGLLNETKFGLLNLSLAAGKRNDVPFNIRESLKIHFGYINYF